MVSISFGASNFSKAQNSYQMTIALVMLVIVMCAVSSIITMTKMNESSPSEPAPASKTEDEAAVKELQKAVEDLETIKDRIKNAEEGYREKYRSETNNGLTVVGTLMEQMIDVMVAVLKQPLVAEAISKRIVNKQDADEIAEYIEMLGKEVVKEVEQTQLLKCRKARTLECTEDGELELCTWKEVEGDVPTSNCDAYELNRMEILKGQRRAAANLYNKVLSVVEKAEERDKMYRITKNVAIDNMTQYGISSSWSDEDIKNRADNFPEQDKLETTALAHYKYLGHELKRELGESINIRELTGEEEKEIKYLKNRRGSIQEVAIIPVEFNTYEEPDYKGNGMQFNSEFKEGEKIKLGNTKNNPIKSLRLGKYVTLYGRRVDNDSEVKVDGPIEDNNTGSGYYDVTIIGYYK